MSQIISTGCCVLLLFCVATTSDVGKRPGEPRRFPGLPTPCDLVRQNGFHCTDIEIITEDGYILWMHRIANNTGPSVLMQHGLANSADNWVLRGRNQDLAYLLADKGYDVWLSNQRGTAYSEYHLKYKSSDFAFWDFSFHEAGYYDLPAFIDSILKISGSKKLFYIGHSMGTAVFYVMASTRPEYNSKIRAAILLSPVAYIQTLDELAIPYIRIASENIEALYEGLIRNKRYQLFSRSVTAIKATRLLCGPSPTQNICLDLLGSYLGEHRANLDRKRIGYYISFSPSGVSAKTIYHFGQCFKLGEFQQIDYGSKINFRRYNSTRPPQYRLEDITAKVAMFWSYNDNIISEKSVNRIASRLPNLIYFKAVPDPKFSHVDFIIGKNSHEMVYSDIIVLMKTL